VQHDHTHIATRWSTVVGPLEVDTPGSLYSVHVCSDIDNLNDVSDIIIIRFNRSNYLGSHSNNTISFDPTFN
jgi:hypothetical protein